MKIFFAYRHSFILLIICCSTSLFISNTKAAHTPAIQGIDLTYVILEMLKLKGLSIKKEKGKITYFTDYKKLTEEEKEALNKIENIWVKSITIGKPIDLKKIGITLTDTEQQELFTDSENIKRLHKNVTSYIERLNCKTRLRAFRYSFDAKNHILCSDLYSHNLITPAVFNALEKRDKKTHIEILKTQCSYAHTLLTRETYYNLTDKIASTSTKDDTEVFLRYTPIPDETDQASGSKPPKKGKNKSKKEKIPLVKK